MNFFPLWEVLVLLRKILKKLNALDERVQSLDAFVREQFTPEEQIPTRWVGTLGIPYQEEK